MTTKKCIECKEDILRNAIKCKHCGSFQKRLKYKNEIAYILLLLTLILSSITFYTQLNKLIDLKEGKVSKIEFDIIDTYNTDIKILARNEGNVPAVIKGGFLTNSLKNGPLISCKIPFSEPILIKPNEYIIYSLQPYCGIPKSIYEENKFYLQDLKKAPRKANCKISLDVMQQGHINTYKNLEFECISNEAVSNIFDAIESNKTSEKDMFP